MNFYFPFAENPDHWSQQACVFISRVWEGEIRESEEMLPKWFRLSDIPFGEMWPDASHWLPRILNGEMLRADFLFDQDINIVDKRAVTGHR